jgi:hypothetical protein
MASVTSIINDAHREHGDKPDHDEDHAQRVVTSDGNNQPSKSHQPGADQRRYERKVPGAPHVSDLPGYGSLTRETFRGESADCWEPRRAGDMRVIFVERFMMRRCCR